MFPTKNFDPTAVAFDLGDAAINQAIDRLERIRDVEKKRRQDINAAEMTSLVAELVLRTEQRDELQDAIRKSPTPYASPRQSRAWYVVVAAILGLAGFAFAHLALTPFGIRWEAWPIAVALSVVCAYATDESLERCACERMVTAAALVSFVMSLSGLLIMALVRGDLLVLFLRNAMASGTLDPSASAGTGDAAAQFYQDAAWKLRLFFGLLAVSMELATGLAIYGVRKIAGPPPNGLGALRQQVQLVEAEMLRLLHRVEYLKREAEIFANEFTRDFYLGLIKGAATRSSKHIGPLLGLVLLATACLKSQLGAQPLDVAVGIDLSLTSAAKTYDGHLEHEKNVEGVVHLIRTLPAAARFRVMGVSDQSFSRPLTLLEGQIPPDRGPLDLIDRIAIAQRAYADQARRALRAATPTYRETDVIGFLLVAAEFLGETPRAHKVLMIFSDMRHSAPPPNIETAAVIPVVSALRTVERQHQIADLRGVDVYVYGAHAADKDVTYWQSLRAFWTEYFAKSGAALKNFSMMRDVADVAR